MRNCTKCGVEFEPTAGQIKKHWWFCPACRSAANRVQYLRNPRRTTKTYWHLPNHKAKQTIRNRKLSRLRWRDPEQREKMKARRLAQRAVIAGKLERKPCSLCGGHGEEMHHSDYSKPLIVVWLCAACHRAHHKASTKRISA